MPLSDIPQWAHQSFVRSLQAVGATADREALTDVCRDVLLRWCSPERTHHNIHHVLATLTAVNELTAETHSPDQVRLAAWFHGIVFSVSTDAIYSHNGGEDEAASAIEARQILEGVGVPAPTAEAIANLIRGMRDRRSGLNNPVSDTTSFDAVDIDQIALRDAHLSVLATDPQDYRKYAHGVRSEYATVSDANYYAGRIRVIQRLLSRKRLFLSPLAHDWEDSARQNLSAELERIEAMLKDDSATDIDGSVDEQVATPVGVQQTDSGENETGATTDTAPQAEAGNVEDHVVDLEDDEDELSDDDLEALRSEDEEAVKKAESSRGATEEFKSTLREPDESFEPGAPPRELNPQEQEISRREKISEDTLKLIDSRQESAQESRAVEEDAQPTSGLEKAPDPDL